MLVKVECEGGVFGWGEAGLSGRELAVQGAVDHYKQFLIGQDGMRIGALWQEMCKRTGLQPIAQQLSIDAWLHLPAIFMHADNVCQPGLCD